MKIPWLAFLLLALCITGLGCTPSEGHRSMAVDSSTCDEDDGGLTLPHGFCATVFADTLGGGRLRHVVVDGDGTVYAMNRREHGILVLQDTDGDGKSDSTRTFGPISGTGIDIHNGWLYATTDTSVHRYPLTYGQPGEEPELVVGGFPDQPSHASKAIAFDDAGHLYVDVGAPSNACQEERRAPGSRGLDPCPQLDRQGGVWRFQADVPGQTQEDDGHRFATGIRNALALAWHPGARRVYAVQHGRDQLSQLWGDLYTDEQNAELPAEEMFRLEDGADFGWPYCFYDHLQGMRVLAPEYGGDGTQVGRCAGTSEPIVAFPGHYAPNDLIFYTGNHFPDRYRNGAFIAFHGSWNRAPLAQQGYLVAFVPMSKDGHPTGPWETFADGFAGTDVLSSPGDAAYRPTGLALGPDGTIYVTDSAKGRIWRILYRGS